MLFSIYYLPYALVAEMLVQVNPPSTVLSREEELAVAEVIAHPTVVETKSIWVMFLKFLDDLEHLTRESAADRGDSGAPDSNTEPSAGGR